MARSLFSGSPSPTVFIFPDGQPAGETFRIVQPGDDGVGSILARRYRVPGDYFTGSTTEYQSFDNTAAAYAWIAEGVGGDDAWDVYCSRPIAGLEIVEPAPEMESVNRPARTKKPAAEAAPTAPSGRRPRAVTSSAD